MTNALITQAGAEGLTIGDAKPRISQSGAEVSVVAAGSKPRIAQAGAEVSVKALGSKPRVTQAGFEVLASLLPVPVVAAVGLCSNEIELDVTTTGDAVTYHYYRSATSGGTFVLIHSSASATYIDTVAQPFVDYFYRVQVDYVQGAGPTSAEISGQSANVPAKVTDLAAVPGDHRVMLTWSGGAHTTSFRVYRRLINSPLDSDIRVALDIVTTNFTDDTAENDIGYLYSVTAVNNCGQSLVSDEIAAIPHCCLGEWSVSPRPSTSWTSDDCGC